MAIKNKDMDKNEEVTSHAMNESEQVAEEVRTRNSNGNQDDPSTMKPGGAERGGPGLDKATDRQPPQSER